MTDTTHAEVEKGLEKRLPTPEEISSAAHAATAIAIAMDADGNLKVSGQDGDHVHIAPAVGHLIIDLLGHVASGNMVTLVPVGTMLTTQEAADMLNVSRPHLTKLLKAGEIEFEEVGKHRRVPLEALTAYRDRKRQEREDALDELARLGQEFDAA
ncbi:helix-turn-helix domain-containing protein [Salipiger sp. P9]|jgi:excisionase family DNA binding protein|uniref:helix-turn-helix domain-containing protein n=1 Tax=Salipiger pentaromativorans TaxID=2943193 RepID=UPI00215896D0|nr:helix-turn-helix domain-containing protein [Salipiger pentaromativorans]MCR8549996.1 helix-turn-helix domain-containing protein [Salipiger pentaromativorans]